MDSNGSVADVLIVGPEAPSRTELQQVLRDLLPSAEARELLPFQTSTLEPAEFDFAFVDGRASTSWIPEIVRALRSRAPALPIVLVVSADYDLEVEALEWGVDECSPLSERELSRAFTKAKQRRRDVQNSARLMAEATERVRITRLKHHNDALRTLATQLAASDLSSGLKAIAEAAATSLGVSRVTIWLVDNGGDSLSIACTHDPRFEEHTYEFRVFSSLEYPQYFKSLRQERVISVDDVRDSPALSTFVQDYFGPLGIVSVLDAPVRAGDRVLGAICHEQVGTPREWTEDDHAMAGHFADVLALSLEFHEHKKVEEDLRNSKAQLDDARRIEAVGRLAGGVAHDFNNVITVVSSYAFLLARKLDRNDPLQGPVAEIGKAAERAADVTRKLLALSRRDPVTPRVLDLNVVLRGMETFIRRLIGEHITFELLLSKDPLLIRADPGQIEQVVLNLVVNARDAAAPEGGTITLRTQREGSSRKQGAGRFILLEVGDNGIGMPKDIQDRIFEPFFTTKDIGKGSGLGLFTVWGTVSQMGGTIEVKSAPNKGSRFLLRFAEASPEAGPVVQPTSRGELMGVETVLLVEDEAQVREVTALILKDLGYKVLEAENIEQAIAHATGAPHIDLLVSDIVMPRASGPVVAARLKELIPSLRVLFISGYSNDMLSAYDASLGPTLPKPFTVEQIGKKVREVLRRDPPRKRAN